jgi:hypothetical protein
MCEAQKKKKKMKKRTKKISEATCREQYSTPRG